ncbi:contractile injection system protein, VgrG/Pvc8 family [Geobacter sp.]|uniref:phage late control D family protein n=1 Tax=Geobacter sp. TaxID=46610 RepID=UPI00261F5D25|nr:contractile injection system protein, VgrG/Pvc8 family [Geobacter sp.]
METLASQPVRQPVWILEYETKDISVAIAPYVLQVIYIDNLAGESDELEINIEDRDHRWKNTWAPAKGDRIRLTIGYRGETMLPCGDFQVDEIEYNGPPDTVSIRCLAAGVTESLRTKNSQAFEGMTLRKIAERIAAGHGLTVSGTVPEIRVERVTQNRETDLAFLKRLALAYGYVFSVRGTQLVWHEQERLDQADAVAVVRRTGLAGSYTLRTKSSQVYRGCQVSYFDPKKKKLITHTFKAAGITTGDVLKLTERCESKAQAEIKAKAALRNANGRQVEGTLPLQGDQRLVAGLNVTLEGWGVLDDTFQVLKSRHVMERGGGYRTEIEVSTTSAAKAGMKNLRNEKKFTRGKP